MKNISELKDFAGQYEYYPDLTTKRKVEGGYRLSGSSDKNILNTPLVSIITVVYNAKDTLERTILSVINQTYENIEYIIIDGGSTDGSLEIIKKYDKKLAYYLSEPDDGIYNAMNKGISLAKGDYICLLNADDYYSDKFISESMEIALNTKVDIVYSDYFMFGKETYSSIINEGIYIHYLNINHSTFLVSKETYNKIGPYREDYKIVSDAVWMRTAFKNDIHFIHLSKSMFYFTEGGLSSGNSEKRRKLFIEEVGRSYREMFNFLTQNEAEELYLSRFNLKSIDTIWKLYNRYANKEVLFELSLKKYLEFILSNKFIFKGDDINSYLTSYVAMCDKLNIEYNTLNIIDNNIDVNNMLSHIDNISKEINSINNKQVILHFVSKFSTPSETFIYDLIQRLEDSPHYMNIVLCDERLLLNERPFNKCIQIDWDNTSMDIREFIYLYIFKKINPDAVIAHFAINGWKLHQRLEPLDIKVPTIHMTHGIDVFSISNNEKYREYILDYACIDPTIKFTTVSQYLLKELVDRGVPTDKISLVPNVVHDRFFQYRKTSNFYDKSRDLKILNVGRLVGWKGHSELIDGIDYYVKNISENIHLTILYGNADNDLTNIMEKIETLNLTRNISLVKFINFNDVPNYYSNFDLFISSSKYTEGVAKRSETFGMSTLEAIAAGLPVIVTDAGGSPEVVGNEKIYAKIVPYANGLAIGKAIESFVEDNQCFSDNLDYAIERLENFNATKQINQLSKVISKITDHKMKVGIFSSIIHSGAGGAATRVHKALLINNVQSTIITRNNTKTSSAPSYQYLSPEIGLKWDTIQSKNHIRPGYTIFSLNEANIKRNTLKKFVADQDVINIQWVARFLTAEDIGYLSNLDKPLVVTVRDMHPLTGGCHFFHGCEQWKNSCYGCPQLIGDEEHFPAKILAIKKRYWNMDNITFVALSQHTKNIIEQSSLYSNNRIEIIANPIELDIFTPTPKDEARKYFKIEKKTPLLFYVPSYGSHVKGSHEFKEALHYVKKKYPNFELSLIMAGSATTLTKASDFLYPIIQLGRFSDNTLLAKAYSSADATIVPSLEETFSNTAAESISCGTPVIGFKTGAIPEITGDGDRGKSVTVGDIEALGEAIYSVLSQNDLGQNCRSYAEENFSFKKQGGKYAALFNELKKAPKVTNILNPNAIPLIDSSISSDLYHWQAKTLEIEKKDIIAKSKIEKKDNIAKSKHVQTNNQSIHRFKENFNELCKTSTLKSPLQKSQKYKAVLVSWYDLKKEQREQIHGVENFEQAFKDLRMISIKKAPIKKLKSYKKLITVWYKYKDKS